MPGHNTLLTQSGTYVLDGNPLKSYDLRVRLRAAAELSHYVGGVQQDFVHRGGNPELGFINTLLKLTVDNPVQTIYLNSAGTSTNYSVALDYYFDLTVYGGAALQLSLVRGNHTLYYKDQGDNDIDVPGLGVYDGEFAQLDFAGRATAQFAQPLYFPAPFVAYGTAPHVCYSTPVLLYTMGTNPGLPETKRYAESNLCGDSYRYDACNGNQSVVVVYPEAASPHGFVSYASACYALNGSVIATGTYTVTASGSVSPVTGCADVICTGSYASGSTVVYRDYETGVDVNVRFDRFDLGIPFMGAATAKVDPGSTILVPGRADLFFRDRIRLPLMTAPNSGRLQFQGLPGIHKKLIITRSGVGYATALGPAATAHVLDIAAGDSVSLDIGNLHGRLTARTQGLKATVTWKPVADLPRLYDTQSVAFSGSSSIRAVGFAGLTNRQDYTLHTTLPADVEMDFVNPDSLVTAQGSGGLEYLLVRARAYGDLALPANVISYAGQVMQSPVALRFYAARTPYGAHGEVDIWLDSDQTLPTYLKSGDYRVLAYGTYSYRRTDQVDDTRRNSLTVLGSPTGVFAPRLYAADDGEVISAMNNTDETVFVADKPFDFSSTVDYGVSSEVLSNLESLASVATTGTVTGLPSQPRGIAYYAPTSRMYVVSEGGMLTGINTSTDTVVSSADLSANTRWVAYCATTQRLYSPDMSSPKLCVADPATGLAETSISLGSVTFATGVAYCPLNDRLYVSCLSGGILSLLKVVPQTGEYSTITLGVGSPGQVVYAAERNEVFIVNEGGASYAVNVTTDALRVLDSGSNTTSGFAYSPQFDRLFATTQGGPPSNVYGLDADSSSKDWTTAYVNSVRAAFFHPVRRKLYCGLFTQNTIRVLRPSNGSETAVLDAGGYPFSMAYQPDSKKVYATISTSNQIRIVT